MSLSKPYREAIQLVPPLPEPKPLFEFHPWLADKHLVTSKQYAEKDKENFFSHAFCPKCGVNTLYLTATTICTGKRAGLCKKIICAETREHFHIHCERCSFRGRMETSEVREAREEDK